MAVAHEASSSVRLEPAVSEAAERMFQEHSGWIYGYCLRLLRSPEEAEDALQATYLNACRSLKNGFEPKVDSAWLLRIAQNVCLTRLRSSGRRARLERVQDTDVIEETVAAPDRRADELIGLGDALASLPEQQRRAILLREWQGLSYAEVAARLDLTQSAVETLLFRARRSLASALENPGKRRRLRLAHTLDVAGAYAAIKGFFAGSASAKIAAATVLAATTATVAATDPAGVWRDRPQGTPPTSAQESSARSGNAAADAAVAYLPTPVSQTPADGAERRFFALPAGPAAQAAQGLETAEEARTKARGRDHAPGQAKEKKAKKSNGQGGGKPAAPGSSPSPNASTQGQANGGDSHGSGGSQGSGSSGSKSSPPAQGGGQGKAKAGGPSAQGLDSSKGKAGQ